ncbi:MAG TPA: urea carboxylase-associated family protein, partial [Parafilimonas sp.]
MQQLNIIPPRSGVSFILKKDQRLKVVDIEGEQVSDFICYNLHDKAEYLSSGRTIDYAETIYLTKGNLFYSNRSNVMFEMIEDTVGQHDFLLTPCSAEMFRIIYGDTNPHRGCFGN